MKKPLIQWLGLLGLVSFLSYLAAVLFSPLAYPGYNWMAQAVSDLSASTAPSRILWGRLSTLYELCGMVSIMMVCVFIQGRLTRTLRLGIYLFTAMNWVSAAGYGMFPLLDGGMLGASFQDIMHVVVTVVVVLLSVLSLATLIMGGSRDRRYRSLSRWAIAALLLMLAGTVGVSLAPPAFFGIPERFSVIAATGFNAVLGLYLFRGFPEDTINAK